MLLNEAALVLSSAEFSPEGIPVPFSPALPVWVPSARLSPLSHGAYRISFFSCSIKMLHQCSEEGILWLPIRGVVHHSGEGMVLRAHLALVGA